MDNHEKLRDIVRQALGQAGDNLCWGDIYNAEVAALVGVPWPPTVLDPDQMLRNCQKFVSSLLSACPYHIGELVGKFSTERLLHLHCAYCQGWWTIGDGDPTKNYFCPRCGRQQHFESV